MECVCFALYVDFWQFFPSYIGMNACKSFMTIFSRINLLVSSITESMCIPIRLEDECNDYCL